MLIGLISDTHIPDRARELPKNVISSFENVDLILHAGDLTSTKVIDELEKIVDEIEPTAEFNRTMVADEFRQSLSSDSNYTSTYSSDDDEEDLTE